MFFIQVWTLYAVCAILLRYTLPLNEQTHYLIDEKLIQTMKTGVMLINTSRGAIVKTKDVIDALDLWSNWLFRHGRI